MEMDTDTPAPLPSPVVPAKDDDPAAPATKEEETAEGDEWFYFDTKFDLSLQESRLFSPKTIDPSGTHSWRLMLFPRGNGNAHADTGFRAISKCATSRSTGAAQSNST